MDYSRIEKSDLWIRLLLEDSRMDEVCEFKNLDTTGVSFSKAYYRKKRRILRSVFWKPILSSIKATAMKAAMVFLVIFSCSFVTVMAIPPLREAVVETVVEWFDDHKEITFVENNTGNEIQLLDKIEAVHKPTALPNGVLEEVLVFDDTLYLSEYYLDGEWIATFSQELKTDAQKITIDTENRIFYKLTVNEKEIEIYEKTDTGDITAFWCDDYYVYFLDALDLDIVLELIYGIK